MKTFTKNNLSDLLKDIDEALAVVAEKHGVDFESVHSPSTRFTSNTVSIKLSAAITDEAEGIFSAEQVQWNRNCHRFGLAPADYGKTFYLRSLDEKVKVTAVGVNPRAKKYPIVVQNEHGILYKMDLRTFKAAKDLRTVAA